MADRLVLGSVPADLTVALTDGADFTTTLRLDKEWPTGAVVALKFGSGTTWEATVAGPDARFHEDRANTTGVPHGDTVRLVVTDGDEDQVWAIGKVHRL